MNLFGNLFSGTLTVGNFCLGISCAAVLGVILALCFMYKNSFTKSFISALVLIPAIETAVIILVNDNLGMGLSVAGSFALIRFRSVKGTAKELVSVFMAMTIGVVCGSGYLVLAALMTAIICGLMLLLTFTNFGKAKESERYLKITIPESLNYDDAFSKVLDKYTSNYELESVKTLNLGSLFRVEYKISLKDNNKIKAMIDEIRTLNGNLEILCTKMQSEREDL